MSKIKLSHLSTNEFSIFKEKSRREKKLFIDSIKAKNKILADNYSRG